MILHLQGIHSASDEFFENFRSHYPHENVVIRFHDDNKSYTVIKDNKEIVYNDERDILAGIDFSSINVVVVYFLDFKKELFILKYITNSIPIIWWMYGGDLYGRLYAKGYDLFAPQTLPFVKGNRINVLRRIKRYLYQCKTSYVDKKIFKTIKGVIPCAPPDYALACSLLGRKVDLVDIVPLSCIKGLPLSNGKDICIGHSASLTSNHLYALDFLRQIDIDDSDVVLPLSYTIHSKEYRDSVVERYRQVYGNRARFLFDYQDIQTYQKNFLNYKVAIYPNWRQEALGNIEICLQLGVKVFLSIHNPCFDYFKNKGFCIYALENIKTTEDLCPLTIDEKEANRKLFNEIQCERDIVAPENLKSYFAKYV